MKSYNRHHPNTQTAASIHEESSKSLFTIVTIKTFESTIYRSLHCYLLKIHLSIISLVG